MGLLVAIVLAVLAGGDLRRLASMDVKRYQWLFASLVTRFLAENVVFGDSEPPLIWSATIMLASYGALLYGLRPNYGLPGMRLVALGSLANFVVLASNSWRMPVKLDFFDPGVSAQEAARLVGSLTHRVLDASTRVPLLADIFVWNYLTGRQSMFSVGDVFIVAGVGWLIFRTAKPRFSLAKPPMIQ